MCDTCMPKDIQLSNDRVDTTTSGTLEEFEELLSVNFASMFSYTYYMIESSVLGASVFQLSNSLYSATFDVLIKILDGLLILDPNTFMMIRLT